MEDIQNTPPKFIGSLTGVVQEDAPINTLVMTVHAKDGDRGMPRKVVYELITSKINCDPIGHYYVSYIYVNKHQKSTKRNYTTANIIYDNR